MEIPPDDEDAIILVEGGVRNFAAGSKTLWPCKVQACQGAERQSKTRAESLCPVLADSVEEVGPGPRPGQGRDLGVADVTVASALTRARGLW